MIAFEVPGQPRGKERPRKGSGGHFYTPEATRDYEEVAQVYARMAMAKARQVPMAGAVLLLVLAVYAMPKSWSRNRQDAVALQPELCVTKPDFDNVGKAVADALNGIAWNDDAQVACGAVLKQYGARPRVEVRAYPAADHRAFAAALSQLLESSNASIT